MIVSLVKKVFLICFFCLLMISVFSQSGGVLRNNNCVGLKLDTLEADFIMEINSNSRFYSTTDVNFQKNLIFISPKFNYIDTPQALYKTDSVFIYHWNEGAKYLDYKSCIDINSITRFHDMTENPLNKKKYKKKIRRNITTNKDGVVYLRFYAKLVLLDIGNIEWNVPWIYCNNGDAPDNQVYKYCKRSFSNTFQFIGVLDFKYYSETKTNKKSN